MARLTGIAANLSAFLDTIAYSEGTAGIGDNGYNEIVGGDLFSDYSDHPRKKVTLNKAGLVSSAAGRYQILERNYDAYSEKLNLPDFSPESQDAIAIQLIKERQALDDVESGNFNEAIRKCSNIWASFPGAGYGQRENKLSSLSDYFVNAGGTLAT